MKEDQKVTESGRKPKQILRKAKNLEGRPGVRRIAEGQENPEGSQNKNPEEGKESQRKTRSTKSRKVEKLKGRPNKIPRRAKDPEERPGNHKRWKVKIVPKETNYNTKIMQSHY